MKPCLAIPLILIVGGWYFGLGGCFFAPGRNELRSGSMAEYMRSDVSSWIAIPPSSADITTFRFLGFDTNYRYLTSTVQPETTDLAELCSRSIALQPSETNASMAIFTNIHMSGFATLFGRLPRSAPSWWASDDSQYDRQYLCTWESTNHYGHGYLFLLDSKKGRLRAFQWIQQWNTVARTKAAFEKNVELAWPGDSPQGAGSPAP